MRSPWILAAVFIVQAFCAIFFVSDIVFSILGIYVAPLAWQTRELLEIGAALGLILGLGFGGYLLVRSLKAVRSAERKLRVASGAFMDVLAEHFAQWGLTASERDVALFAIKGLSTAEIAELRSTSEGTVKAQTNSIYRKAGVSGRPQLLSVFIEDLLEGPLAPLAPPAAPAAERSDESLPQK